MEGERFKRVDRSPLFERWKSVTEGRPSMPSESCEEYRNSQRLLALKIRLSEKNLDPEERREIARLIEELEKKLKL
jgi:hypothetical protein